MSGATACASERVIKGLATGTESLLRFDLPLTIRRRGDSPVSCRYQQSGQTITMPLIGKSTGIDACAFREVEHEASKSGALAVGMDTNRLRPRLFRWHAPPYLLLGDLFAVGVWHLGRQTGTAATLAGLLGLLLVFKISGLYRSRLTLSVLDDLPYLASGVVLLATIVAWIETSLLDGDRRVSARVIDAVGLLLVVLVVRGLAYYTVHAARRSGRVRHTAMILGAGHVGLRLAETLLVHREFGLDVVGLVDPRPRIEGLSELPAPMLGGYEELSDFIEEFAVKVVIVAFGSLREYDLVEVLRTCDRLHCEIMFVPRLFELHATTRDMDQVWGIPLVRVRRAPFRTVSWRVKRLVDAVLAALALAALSPLVAACALAVRLESGPGFLFRQERVGLDGRSFTLLKFRSLRPATADESATKWNISLDDRLGPVGKILRRTSLDELPQLWNVICGNMSLVGPRPERQHFVDQFSMRIPRYTARHRVPAGLTGWAQVHGLRGDTSIEERASFDNYYIENWSLWGDVKIMVRTLQQVLQRSGG